mgnify:CR=1 FL=1
MIRKILFFLLSLLVCGQMMAASVSYQIVEYNKDKADFALKAFGEQPKGAVAIFDNPYGATTGNRYNQVPRNKTATLYLQGWEGCTVNSVTLNMCSNAKSGSFALKVTNGETTLYTMSAKDFSSDDWYGQWVSKDLGVYVDLTKEMQLSQALSDEELAIAIVGGTSEGSVYINRITIDYTPSAAGTESAMSWSYSKLEKKDAINDGDVVIMYRSGSAAGDIDGISTSHYLDAIGVASTSSLYEPDVSIFTLTKDASGYWTFTDQYGRVLGATAAQHLAWDEGVTTWTVSLGYDGATIASTNTNYGTMRYNAPSGSYARFWNYKSTSLQLPYLYRRGSQNQPVVSTALTLSAIEREADMAEQDTVVLKYTLSPSTTTDVRVRWSSSDASVATVSDGIVRLHSAGSCVITAESLDGGSQQACNLNVVNTATAIESLPTEEGTLTKARRYTLDGVPANQAYKGVVLEKAGTGKTRKVRIK